MTSPAPLIKCYNVSSPPVQEVAMISMAPLRLRKQRWSASGVQKGNQIFGWRLRVITLSTELIICLNRAPVVIFLSDGEWNVTDQVMHTLCRSAVRLGWGCLFQYILFIALSNDSNNPNSKTLSFHGVAFGPDSAQQSLRRMVQIAREVETTVPTDCASPAVESSYAEALDTVRIRANSHLIQILTLLIVVLYVRLTWPRHSLVWQSLSGSLAPHLFEVEAQFFQRVL